MSFLYQALIKEQQKEQQGGQPSANSAQAEHGQVPNVASNAASAIPNAFTMASAATTEQESRNHWFWLAIAALLMLVGLLGGYLFGSKDTNQVMYSNIQQQASQVQQKQQELEQNLADLKESAEKQIETSAAMPVTKAQVEQEVPAEPDKQIEVAVGQDGKVKTQVTDIDEDNQSGSAEEEQLVKRNILPEVAIQDIPDALKSTFADAVKATERTQQPDLFQTEVSSGSSLSLIDELKLSEIYWVPDISYEMHIYASEPSERWIRINGKTLAEGEALIDNLVLLEIRQDQIIWQSDSRRFAQNALQDFVKQ